MVSDCLAVPGDLAGPLDCFSYKIWLGLIEEYSSLTVTNSVQEATPP